MINRTGHNLSAHYNGYYNAGLKLEDGLAKLALSHEDHYDRPLTVFQYADAEKSKAIYPQLEDAMKRTSTIIARHTMYDKRGNEIPNSEKWIDDNWLLYGKCQFFKHDYFEAIETFKYVEATYKRDPGRHLGSLWLAKTYLELTELREAEEKLDYLRNISDFPKKNIWELEAVNADFYLQVKNYDKAIVHLTRAAELVPEREKKIRFLFILAQLHEMKGNFKQAYDLYTRVIKKNPKYELDFNARLNRARCYDTTSGNSETVRNELLKMEKDPKNKDFLDQIYYSLAGLARNEGKKDEEIEFLQMSVTASTNNQNQKALSYLQLAKIAYSVPDYRKAAGYYDSTITNLAKDYPDYTDILSRRNSLVKLVKNMKIIETEDSLQQLSNLSPAERANLVDKVLNAEEEERKKQAEIEQSNLVFNPGKPSGSSMYAAGGGSSWYFYNAQTLNLGAVDFQKKFGSRKLEDNWRRSKKQILLQDNEAPLTEDSVSTPSDGGSTTSSSTSADRRNKMISSIPSDQEAVEKSNGKIVEAYYNIGMIYREQLGDLKASATTFEELLRRFPQNKYQMQCYYQLYRTYAVLNDINKSNYYRDIILNQHGETEYAEIIRNPNYAQEKANRKSNLEIFYEETYRKFLNGEYATVIRRKDESDLQFPQNAFAPKFDMLKTLSVGRTQPLPVFEASLKDIVKNHSADSVMYVAQDILDYIHNQGKNISSPGEAPIAFNDTSMANRKLFFYFPDTLHNVILIFQNIGGPLNPDRLKNKITDFNRVNFASKNITLQDFLFDHRNKIFVLKSFPNKQEALQFRSLLFDNDDVFGNISPEAYQLYVISVNNMAELLTQKKTDKYEDFYREFYK